MKLTAAQRLHPLSAFLYSGAFIIISMALFNPYFLAAAVVVSTIQAISTSGPKKVLKTALFIVPFCVIIAFFNPIISHGGKTLLFYAFSLPITFEAVFYGICSGAMLYSIMMFFVVYNSLVPPDKFMFLFSKVAPAFSMVVMMTQRFIPLFKKRFSAISAAQKTFMRNRGGKLKTAMRENSMLLSWSMEEGLETADSMKARGYGAAKRSSFSIYKFSAKDAVLVFLTLCFSTVCLVFYAFSPKIRFYPRIILNFDIKSLISLLAYIFLGIFLPAEQGIRNILFSIKERKFQKHS